LKLSAIKIENLRRIAEAEVKLSSASFLIGQNNHGKSSILRAISLLLSNEAPAVEDFRQETDGSRQPEIRITGYFSSISPTVASSRGFKGRVVDGQYCYRKIFALTGGKKGTTIECQEYPYAIKPQYQDATTYGDLIEAGLPGASEAGSPGARLKAGWERDFLDDAVDFDLIAEPTWVQNPGGIPGNVLSKLPLMIHVPPLTAEGDIGDASKKSLIQDVLGLLFTDVLEGNELAIALSGQLKELEKQMSPEVDGSIINNLCTEVNKIICDVFPGCGIRIDPSLDDLATVLKPKYNVSLFSNVPTDVKRQGTGLLRTAVFSMFRYHAHLKASKEIETRPLIVAFEEPELYLHPAAANLLRDTIYALAKTDQIVCTTHSPWMVDLSRDLQSLTKMVQGDNGTVYAINYGVSEELSKLLDDDRTRVKMLQVFDDELSRAFFSDNVVVVEGDSEVVAIKATINLLPEEVKKAILSTTHVVKARGKASISSLVKYLRALSIEPLVIHDRDAGTAGAVVFNQPIANAVGNPDRCVVLLECLENALGYPQPGSEKPFRTFQRVATWSEVSDIPTAWLDAFSKAFGLAVETSQDGTLTLRIPKMAQVTAVEA